MPVGLEIINDAGTILIDSASPTLAMRQKVAATSDAGKLIVQTFNAVEFPTLALRSTAGWVALVSAVIVSGNMTYTLRTQNASQAVTLYFFDRPAISAVGYGFQVFDDTGKLTFDAAQKPGRVAGVQASDGIWTGTAGIDYAAIMSCASYGYRYDNPNYYQPGDPNPYEFVQYWDRYDTRSGVSNSGATVVLGTYDIAAYLNEPADLQSAILPPNIETGGARVTVLDVTGY